MHLRTYLISILAGIQATASQSLSGIASWNHANGSSTSEVIPSRGCSTTNLSNALLDLHQTFQSRGPASRSSPESTMYMIDVYFHFITTSDEPDPVKPWMIASQFGVLQRAFAPSNISFHLAGVDFTQNNTWATDQADADMKYALRQGNYSTLNLYFQSNLSTLAYGSRTQLLGYCTLPTKVTYSPCVGCAAIEYPAVDYSLDGCNVLVGTMPGGSVQGYNLGKTAVHEVGHWFGLLHTFQDTTCAKNDPGDYIDDTPQESVSTVGCPEGKDSCPDSPGLDPINNYMDYSTDICYESFTTQQIQRMQQIYASLRLTF